MLADAADKTADLLLNEPREELDVEQLRRLHGRRIHDGPLPRWIDARTGRVHTQPEALALVRGSVLEARAEAARDTAHVIARTRVLGASVDRDGGRSNRAPARSTTSRLSITTSTASRSRSGLRPSMAQTSLWMVPPGR